MPTGYMCFICEHLKTIDTFEPEYDFFEICQVVYSKEEAEKFLQEYVEHFTENLEAGMTKIVDGEHKRVFIGDPIPKRTTIRNEYGLLYEVQTFENYPDEKAAYMEFLYPASLGNSSITEEKKP